MSSKYNRVFNKKKKKVDDIELDYGENLTELEYLDLILNLTCPNCGWITSFINTLCKVQNIVIATRICERCDKVYEINFNTKFETMGEAEEFWNSIKSHTSQKAQLCKVAQNNIISNYGRSCTSEDCKRHI